MQAATRLGMPQTSFDAAATVNAVDKDKPSPEVGDAVMVAAKSLTRDGEHGNFTDKELRKKTLPYLRAVHGIDLEEDVSSIRRVRLWMSRQPKAEIVLVEGVRREGSQVWKWQSWREPVAEAAEVKTQKGLFDE